MLRPCVSWTRGNHGPASRTIAPPPEASDTYLRESQRHRRRIVPLSSLACFQPRQFAQACSVSFGAIWALQDPRRSFKVDFGALIVASTVPAVL